MRLLARGELMIQRGFWDGSRAESGITDSKILFYFPANHVDK